MYFYIPFAFSIFNWRLVTNRRLLLIYLDSTGGSGKLSLVGGEGAKRGKWRHETRSEEMGRKGMKGINFVLFYFLFWSGYIGHILSFYVSISKCRT